MSSWAGAVRRWHARCSHVDKFGKHAFWESLYARGKAPKEWFLSAELAAASVASAFGAHKGKQCAGSLGNFCKILHLGCGTSALGSALVSAMTNELHLSAHVMNTDYSPAAVEAAAKTHNGQQQQTFRVWDAAGVESPPSLPPSNGGPSSHYDLLVDKGTLDALAFASDDMLVKYLSTLRQCLLLRSPEHMPPPLLVHFTDDPPEVRGELLAAAFPAKEGEGWRVTWSAADQEGGVGGEEWQYYRYTVHASRGSAVIDDS